MAAFQTGITVGQYAGPGAGSNVITRTANGTLYTAVGPTGNGSLTDNPVTVYKSIDYGHNWTVDKVFTQDRSMGNSHWRIAIVVDGNNKLHLAWGSWIGTAPSRHGYLSYATKPSGSSWSGITDIADYVGYTDPNAVYGMVFDSSNQPHILYFVDQYPDTPNFCLRHHWKDDSWHSETVYGGANWQDSATLIVDPSDTLYELYEPGDHYAKKPSGGSWSTAAISDFTPSQFCSDKDGNLHFCSITQYRKLSNVGTWGTLETFASVNIAKINISVTSDGIVHIVGFYGTNHQLRYYERSTGGTWSYTNLSEYATSVPTAGLLHAIFPSNPYYCLLQSGYALISKLSDYTISYLASGEIPGTVIVYPSDAITRVTGLHHIYNPGMYRLGIQLGDVSNTIEIVERAARKKIEEIPEPYPDVVPWPKPVPPRIPEPFPDVVPWPEETKPPTIEEIRAGREAGKKWTPIYGGGLVGGLGTLPGLADYRKKKLAEEQAAKAAKAAQPSLWSKMTPWKEEKGETFVSAIKKIFKKPPKPPKPPDSYSPYFEGF